MTDRRTFHTFAAEFHTNKSEPSDAPIYIATDASLDEGAIIRTTAPSGSPLAGPVQYFVGMDSVEASAVLAALQHLRDDYAAAIQSGDDSPDFVTLQYGIEEVDMMLHRVGRLPYFDGKDQS